MSHSLRSKIQYKYHQQARFPRIEDCIASRKRNGIVVPTIKLEYYKHKRPGVIFFVFNNTDPREQRIGLDTPPEIEPINCFLDYDLNTTQYRVWDSGSYKFIEEDEKDIQRSSANGIIIRTNETEFGKTLFIVCNKDMENFRNRPTNI